MRKIAIWITMGCCFLVVTLAAGAQANRKPGLWEMTSTMTWQQSPMPAGMTMPAGTNSPFGGGAHTMQMGANAVPVEYTIVASSAYKGADCGSVKPLPVPDK